MENDIRDDDVALLEVASRIDEDQPIDWDSEEGSAGDDERAVLAELRLLAALTRVYRDPDAVGPETELEVLADPSRLPARWASLTVLELVGKGGFAKVYRARDAFNRDVALKLFPVTAERTDALSSRVLREGSLLAKVSHRNVVVVHGTEQANGFVGLWMEFIHGRTLEDELRARGPLSADEATAIGIDLCQALAAVHRRGLIHRDIKPSNVMREEGGRIVLMDFGAGTEAAGLGRTLDMAGTPLYLAPELFDGRPAAPSSDVYSLGVLLYRLVTRAYPVDGVDRSQIDEAHRQGRITRLRDARPDLPPSFVAAVERALSPQPGQRPQTAGELEAALGGTRERAATWTWKRIAAALVIAALPIAWFYGNRNTTQPSGATSVATTVQPEAPAPPAAVNPTYTVRATLFRTRNGVETPLTAGTSLAAGDQLSMEFAASRDVFVYLLNADDAGRSFRLFPLSGRRPDNPIASGKGRRLPGDDVNWQVTEHGGNEHFVILVTPNRDDAIEAVVRAIPEATEGQPVRAALTRESTEVLRSVGGLAKKSKTAARTASEPSLVWFDGAGELTERQETANGSWMRRLTVPGSAR